MKQFITALVISLGLSSAFVPRQSHAGLLIGAIAGQPGTGLVIGAAVGVALYGGVFIFVDGARHDTFFLFGGSSTIGMALLDVDATMTPDQLTETYKKSFPFVDSSEVIDQLTTLSKEKFHAAVLANPKADQVLVSFTQDEVAQIFAGSDLTTEQLAHVVHVLK